MKKENEEMKNKKAILMGGIVGVFFILCCTALLMAGSSIRIGYVDSSYQNTISASFKYFDGIQGKKVMVNKGEKVTIFCNAEIEEGTLEFLVKDQADNIVVNETGNSGRMEFVAEETQKYTIGVMAAKAKGKFEITWNKE